VLLVVEDLEPSLGASQATESCKRRAAAAPPALSVLVSDNLGHAPWAERGVDGVVQRRPLPLDAYSGHAGVLAAAHQYQPSAADDFRGR
jgi:hypothetical protein